MRLFVYRYTLGDNGVLAVTPYTTGEQDCWFNIQMAVPYYTLKLMAANPLWAPPNATHLLHSTSVVTNIVLSGGMLSYTTFDGWGVERLRLAPGFLRYDRVAPVAAAGALSVSAGGLPLPRLASTVVVRQRGAVGWAYDEGTGVLEVARNASTVVVRGTASQ